MARSMMLMLRREMLGRLPATTIKVGTRAASTRLLIRRADGWWFITATKTIRKNAVGGICFYLDSTLPTGGVIHYDGAVAVVRE